MVDGLEPAAKMNEATAHLLDGPPLQQVEVAGATISYREAGTGTPLLLLHGIGSASGSWQAQLARLSDDFRVIAWDAPGYGGSTPLPEDAPVAADYAAALLGFLDAIGIGTCHLVGHSLGAMMAAAFTARWPDRVDRLVLASTAGGYGTAATGPYPAAIEARLHDVETLGSEGLAAKRAPGLLSDSASPEDLSRVRQAMSEIKPAGYRQATLMLAQGDILADAARISRPTVVISGSADRVTPEDLNRRVAETVAGAGYRSIPGAAHAVYVEHSAAFNDAVLQFLKAS